MCWIFEILRNIYFDFFFNSKLRQQGRDSCLKIDKYYVIFRKFDTYQIAFLMKCQRHLSEMLFGQEFPKTAIVGLVCCHHCLLALLILKEKSKSRRPPTASDSLAREALRGRYWVQIFTVVAKKVSCFSHHYWLVLSSIHQFCVLKFTLWSAVYLIGDELLTKLLCSILIRR